MVELVFEQLTSAMPKRRRDGNGLYWHSIITDVNEVIQKSVDTEPCHCVLPPGDLTH